MKGGEVIDNETVPGVGKLYHAEPTEAYTPGVDAARRFMSNILSMTSFDSTALQGYVRVCSASSCFVY
jgi:hypothetical protein